LETKNKNMGYRLFFGAIGLMIGLTWYLKIRKNLRKYEEDQWDEKIND
jgi:hypothetical protein